MDATHTSATIDRDAITALLFAVDARLQRGGWDVPCSLWWITEPAADIDLDQELRRVIAPVNGPAVRAGRYSAQQMGGRSLFVHDGHEPGDILAILTTAMVEHADKPRIAQMREPMSSPGMRGVAFSSEVWVGPDDAPDRSLADQPGSVEARLTVGATADGRVNTVLRVRGHKPEADHGTAFCGGRIVNCVRALAALITGVERRDLLTGDFIAAGNPDWE